jgi:hypothetical protein
MNASIIRNVCLVFVANLVWVAGVMYTASKFTPLTEHLAFALYWIMPVSVYLLLLHRSAWMPRAHRALRLLVFGAIGLGLGLVAILTIGAFYSSVLAHAINTPP